MEATTDRRRHAGSDWLKQALRGRAHLKDKTISPLGERVADILGELWQGLYHYQRWVRVDWANTQHIRVLTDGNDLATHDFDGLSRLVFLCHREGIRCEVSPCNCQNLELLFHDRREANWHGSKPHPTLQEAVARFEGSV